MTLADISQQLTDMSNLVRWKGVYADYDQCAHELVTILGTDDPVIINDIMMSFSGAMHLKTNCSTYQWCNAIYANMLSLEEPNDIIGKTDFDLKLDDSTASVIQEADELTLNQATRTTEERRVSFPDSTTRVLLTKRYPIADAGGQHIGLLTTAKESFLPVSNSASTKNPAYL